MSSGNKTSKMFCQLSKIWKKISNLMKNEFDSQSVYCDEHIKTKIKSYGDTINTNFQGKKIPKENTQYTCLSVIL